MSGWEDTDEIAYLNGEVERLTTALLHMRGYLKLWSDDVDAGLKPTKGSLSDAWLLMAVTLGDEEK
jgi:hypothetical protein